MVPGGGLAYIRTLPALERLQLEGECQVGVAIVKRALEEPRRQIVLNAGAKGATVVQRCKAGSGATGYDASVAGLLLTTEVLMAELPEKTHAHHMNGHISAPVSPPYEVGVSGASYKSLNMVKTIVWIEDDTDVIDPVVRPLERAGHHFIRIHTVREALDAIDTMRQADLILLDIALPPANAPCDSSPGTTLIPDTGLQLLRKLREAPACKPPVVVLTDLRCPQLECALQALGVADIIYMPVRPTELHQRVEAVWTVSTGQN